LLYITGSESADTASVIDTTPQNNQGVLIVNVNGNATPFAEAAVNGIRFYGYGGNDTFTNSTVKPVVAYGGNGNDTLRGGGASDTLRGEAGSDHLFGYGGNDTMYGSTGNDEMRGGNGNDTMQGGDDNDTMYGDDGNDTMYGQNGVDLLYGGAGADNLQGGDQNDTLYGEAGDDFMTGQAGNDTLYGGDNNDEMYGYTGNDTLRGGNGNDMLGGWEGNDRLFGEEGNDDLYGQDGRDGLFGGNGADYVSGGGDSDRFLTISDEAEIADENTSDAIIRFGGPKAWTYTEIYRVDLGLARIHNRTGNTVLLKDPQVAYNPNDPDAPRMTFSREQTDFDEDGKPWGNVGRNHENGLISLYDSLFSGNPSNGIENKVAQFVIHEIGHFWDQASENTMNLSGENVVDYFRSYSGWAQFGKAATGTTMNVGGVTYVKAGNAHNDDNPWWYRQDASFVTDYAHTSPHEDFADTFSVMVMGNDYHRNGNDTLTAPTGKRAWINAWLDAV